MKVEITKDERYPNYSVRRDPGYGITVDVPDETLARWREVEESYSRIQSEIAEYYRTMEKAKLDREQKRLDEQIDYFNRRG